MSTEKGSQHLKVNMSGWGMDDQHMERWCSWFEAHLSQLVGKDTGQQVVIKELDFSENSLTTVGAGRLLATLNTACVHVLILKLHHNRIRDGRDIADFISGCGGTLQEVHLSHNELSTTAAAEIILAAASAWDACQSTFYYPRLTRKHGGTAAPLWLRLDSNFLDHALLLDRVGLATEQMGRHGDLLCSAKIGGCTPGSCCWNHSCPPAIHVRNLAHQRCYQDAHRDSLQAILEAAMQKRECKPVKESGTHAVAHPMSTAIPDGVASSMMPPGGNLACAVLRRIYASTAHHSGVYTRETLLTVRHLQNSRTAEYTCARPSILSTTPCCMEPPPLVPLAADARICSPPDGLQLHNGITATPVEGPPGVFTFEALQQCNFAATLSDKFIFNPLATEFVPLPGPTTLNPEAAEFTPGCGNMEEDFAGSGGNRNMDWKVLDGVMEATKEEETATEEGCPGGEETSSTEEDISSEIPQSPSSKDICRSVCDAPAAPLALKPGV